MKAKERLIKNLKMQRKNEICLRLIEFILSLIFVVLTPIAIYDILIEKDILITIILCVAEIIFIGISIFLFKNIIDLKDITNSRIYQCIEKPSAATEIIVTPTKIIFELKGMEDESIILKNSSLRIELINNIKEVFGENKIITINQ